MAECAEERKVEKYCCLPASHLFCPVAIETLGAVGPQSLALIKGIGQRIASKMGESRAVPVAAFFNGGTERKLCSCAAWGVLGFDCFIITIICLCIIIIAKFMYNT